MSTIARVLVFLATMDTAFAQLVVSNGTLSIKTSSEVTVNHDVVNRGSITLDGTLGVSGHLINEQTLRGERGTLSLVGEDQRVVANTLTIGSLLVGGGGVKQLESNLSVAQNLSLTSGVVRTDRELVLFPNTTIEGGSAESYVDGFLYHQGTGRKFYPVGRNGTYAPATLQNVVGSNPTVGLAYFATPAFDGSEFHWQQRILEGTYEGSIAELNFTSDNSDYATYANELMVLGAQEGSNAYTVLGQSSLAVRGSQFEITSEQPSALSILTVGFDILENTQNLYLPNAFSPSAASPEDQRIKVYGRKISSRNFYFGVQDTWGNVVYETTSWEEASEQGWSGLRHDATRVAPTYRYLLQGEFIGGGSFHRTGTIVQY